MSWGPDLPRQILADFAEAQRKNREHLPTGDILLFAMRKVFLRTHARYQQERLAIHRALKTQWYEAWKEAQRRRNQAFFAKAEGKALRRKHNQQLAQQRRAANLAKRSLLCPVCSGPVPIAPGKRPPTYCTPRCKFEKNYATWRAQHPGKVQAPCEICRGPIVRKGAKLSKYCSPKCKNEALRVQRAERRAAAPAEPDIDLEQALALPFQYDRGEAA